MQLETTFLLAIHTVVDCHIHILHFHLETFGPEQRVDAAVHEQYDPVDAAGHG